MNILHLSNNEWEEVYKSEYKKTVFNQNQTYVDITGDFYVCEVYFSNLGNDGVIVLYYDDVKSLISRSSFENSSRKYQGGSICITLGQSSIRKVCSFGSKAADDGKFCSVELQKSTDINEVHDSSITYSNQGDANGYNTVVLKFGNISFLQNNITKNYCQYNTAFSIGNNPGTTSIKYSIIDENYAASRICITYSILTKYNKVAFINNTISKPEGLNGMISCQNNNFLDNCFIANNKQNSQYLFAIYEYSSGSITISNSYIDASELVYKPGEKVSRDATVLRHDRLKIE